PAAPSVVSVPQEVRPLPGCLNRVPVLNSNSPEVVQTEGILVSTLPPDGMATPGAHLNFPFNGNFEIFAHHIARADKSDAGRTLYLGVVLKNDGAKPVTIQVGPAASYLSQPDAPFVELAPVLDNNDGTVYAGPGDRVCDDSLREQRQI